MFKLLFILCLLISNSYASPCVEQVLRDLVHHYPTSGRYPKFLKKSLISNMKEAAPIHSNGVQQWRQNNLRIHYQRHGNEFPGLSQRQYADAARRFGNNNDPNTVTFPLVEYMGARTAKVNLATREVLIIGRNGEPITYFKANLKGQGRDLQNMGEYVYFLNVGRDTFNATIDSLRGI